MNIGITKLFWSGVALTVMTQTLGACNKSATTGDPVPQSFRDLCERYPYIKSSERNLSVSLENRIKSGAINPYLDIEYRSGAYNEGVFEKYPEAIGDLRPVRIQVIDVYESNELKFRLRMPYYIVASKGLGVLGPEERSFDCAGIQHKSLYQYF